MTLLIVAVGVMIAVDVALNIATRFLLKQVKRTLAESYSVRAEIDALFEKIKAQEPGA